jgi:uncharacterized protein YukE
MAKVDADPADLRRFAHQLRQFQSEVQSQLNRLSGQLNGMRWSDAQQRRFLADWEGSARSMRAFLSSIDQHSSYLENKSKQLEDYLG